MLNAVGGPFYFVKASAEDVGRFECCQIRASEVALQAASNLLGCAPLNLSLVDVCTCLGIVNYSRNGRHVQRTIESPASSTVQPVASDVLFTQFPVLDYFLTGDSGLDRRLPASPSDRIR